MKQFKRIYIEITNICNLKCSFCPPLNRQPGYMTVTEFSQIIDKISPYTDYVYLHIKGEPLLHPQLEEILNICHEKDVWANITTNGTRISSVQNILYHAPALRQINISLHSFEDIEISRIKELDSYLEEIILTTKYMSKNANTITALRLWNLDKENLTKEAMDRNIYVLNILKQSFPTMDYSVVADSRLRQKGIKLDHNIYLNFDYEFAWPSLDASYIGDTGYCYGLKTQLGILVDGTVVPCCLDGDGMIQLGNLFHEDLNNILSSTKAQNMIEGFACRKLSEELCKRCGYRERFS